MNLIVREVVQQLRCYQQYAEKTDVEEHLFVSFNRTSNGQKIYILNASDKTWINENYIVEELSFSDMTHKETNTNLIKKCV